VLEAEFGEAGAWMGRDRFFGVLRRRGLLVPPLPRSCRTTHSGHTLPVFRNLVKDLETTGPNQAWGSDITYVRTEAGFVYVSLIMDLYSRKIVGFHCSTSLAASGSVRALQKALRTLPADAFPIHHSDRGSRYCCREYVEVLEKRGLAVSMTEENHCGENARVERVNGILKQEYGLGTGFKTIADAVRAVEQAVWLYNHLRPHTSLNYRTPAQVHAQAA